jgi:rubrerythrin
METMTATELLDSALANEKVTADNYETIASVYQRSDAADIAEFFREQANRGRGHYNYLERVRLAIDRNAPSLDHSALPPYDTTADNIGRFLAAGDLKGALQLVEERERDAEWFYRKAARTAKDKALAAVFNFLADDEEFHRQLALRQQGIYKRRGMFITKARDLPQ